LYFSDRRGGEHEKGGGGGFCCVGEERGGGGGGGGGGWQSKKGNTKQNVMKWRKELHWLLSSPSARLLTASKATLTPVDVAVISLKV